MDRQMNSKIPPGEKNAEITEQCYVDKKSFPCFEKCCLNKNSAAESFIEAICPNCEVWKSLPDSDSLKVVTIIECRLYGYGKRIEE
jgi:hypothetical protein